MVFLLVNKVFLLETKQKALFYQSIDWILPLDNGKR